MSFLRYAIVIAILLASGPAKTDGRSLEPDVATRMYFEAWVRDANLAFRINSDPVVRTIVCRIPFTVFTLEAMALATGIPKHRIAHAVNKLKTMDLANWGLDKDGNIVIVPQSASVRREMIRWTDHWCTGDDQCEIGR